MRCIYKRMIENDGEREAPTGETTNEGAKIMLG